VRDVDTSRQPVRLVVDSRLEIAASSRVLGAGSLVAAAIDEPARGDVLRGKGTEVIVLPNASGKVDLKALMQELGRREMNEVHVEAGYKLNGSLLREGLVDELLIYLAPNILGDAARGMFDLPELTDLSGRLELEVRDLSCVGSDIRAIARPKAGR
jgi:diaminohydroxyphosphoribosylaminopyrimidine deaminase/5-amino-6-(5-phosphoribosylamino)uracil reductase